MKIKNDYKGQLKNRLQSKIEEIANTLSIYNAELDAPGVLGGMSGKALFMFYYSRYSGDTKFADIGEQALLRALEIINSGYASLNYYGGISGFAWTCEHLVRQGFIDSDSID